MLGCHMNLTALNPLFYRRSFFHITCITVISGRLLLPFSGTDPHQTFSQNIPADLCSTTASWFRILGLILLCYPAYDMHVLHMTIIYTG